MRTILGIVAYSLLAASSSATDFRPIWEAYPTVICQSTEIVFCSASTACRSEKPSAVFLIDFKAGTIKSAVSPEPTHILKRAHYDVLGEDTISTDDRGTFSFGPPVERSAETPLIKGVTAITGFPDSALMWLDCHPI